MLSIQIIMLFIALFFESFDLIIKSDLFHGFSNRLLSTSSHIGSLQVTGYFAVWLLFENG